MCACVSDPEGKRVNELLCWLWWHFHIWALSYFSILLFRTPGPLCLQLETQADFVSTAVHVLSINQTGEGELHSCTGRRATTEL